MNRHAKILATLGPASNSATMIRELIIAGANGFRLNFSHGDHALHRKTYAQVREISAELGVHVTILQDLQGPKIRLGEVEPDTTLTTNQPFELDCTNQVGTSQRAPLPHPDILAALKPGHRVFINDGLVKLQVTAATANKVTCTVLAGGIISSRKGVNLPDVELPVSALSSKDKEDLKLGLELGVDWVALSFVQRPEDIIEAQNIINGQARIMAKIELPTALKKLEEITQLADGIMVARGDLGVEIPLPEVPAIQKKIIRLCRDAGKPVVVATQMLESMITNASPTRAEVSDVANATYEGADTLMLSAESAAGNYPAEAVQMMQDIITRVEASSAWGPLMDARVPTPTPNTQDALTSAACNTANTIKAEAIITFTQSGSTALRVARWRPNQPILALTSTPEIAHQMGLLWGTTAEAVNVPTNADEMVDMAKSSALKAGLTRGPLVVLAGLPFGQTGSTNLLRVIDL